MGRFLTYKDSKSFANSGLPPDENFARELMQLFTIGLWKLNIDGSFVRDENGEKIPTYNNANIQNFARMWTGFSATPFRGNLEANRAFSSGQNFVDPMQLTIKHHDTLPKLGLNDEYIGDGVQLCTDIPSFSFLKEGAKFKNVGMELPHDGSVPGDLDPTKSQYKYDGSTGLPYKRLILEQESSLYQALCFESSRNGNTCMFPSEVTLANDLQCYGRECFLDKEALYVKIIDKKTNEYTFYQFMQPLCVRLAFYDNPKKLALNYNAAKTMCADPLEAAGGAVCCFTPTIGGYFGFDRCEYHLEKLTWSKAVSRCESIIDDTVDSVPPGPYDMGRFWAWYGGQKEPKRQLEICKKREGASRKGMHVLDGCGYQYRASWINEPCSVQVQVDRFGRINIVHSGTTELEVKLDSGNMFGVHWTGDKGLYPLAENNCGGTKSSCAVHSTTYCLCEIDVVVTAVFSDNKLMPTRLDVVRKLKIGSPAVATFATGTYIKCVSSSCTESGGGDVEVYLLNGVEQWDEHTIFKTFNPIEYRFNRLSTVRLGEDFSFRNVPHFMSLKYASLDDFTAEIDAMINMLLKHENVAPFVATRLIKHLITSNPSPRYIQAVATAFKSGKYGDGDGDGDGVGNGNDIGSGRLGDMSATIAAIMLDPEARNNVLDAEPTFGKYREPTIKFMHILRSLEYQSGLNGIKSVVMWGQNRMGMVPYKSPSVFSFYLPEFQPSGPLGTAGLTAPEMMLGTAPFLLNFLNGAYSLIQNGLTTGGSLQGFGARHSTPISLVRDIVGTLKYSPTSVDTNNAKAVVDELDLVLTNGRLDAYSREIITAAYQERVSEPLTIPVLVGVKLQLPVIGGSLQCVPSPADVRFKITLEPGIIVQDGCSPFCFMRKKGDTDQELKVKINHFSWNGNLMFVYVNFGFTCEAFAKIFQPGDSISFSSTSLFDLVPDALMLAQSLIISSAEFHTTTMNARAAIQRQEPLAVEPQNRQYKAIIVVFQTGGADSWNYLVPYSGCKLPDGSSFDLFGEVSFLDFLIS